MSLQAPTHLGRYEILDEIGRGAMGVVYLAKDPLIGRLVALKTLRVGSALRGSELETFRARFIREAQSAGILAHPNIVTIHDVVEESAEGVTFIAMEYVRGTNLKEVLRTEGRLEPEEAAHVVREVAGGLEYAHSRGVIHRDIKPANILLTEERRIKLTDFGIARIGSSTLTFDGQLLGTPNYMAPEQIRGEPTDHRADVFSLGVVLYEMLIGEKPFRGENVTVVTHRIAYEEPIPPDEHGAALPAPIEEVIRTALAKEPAERFQSAAQMARALEEAVEEVRVQESLNETQEVPVGAGDPAGPPPPVPPPSGAPAAGGRVTGGLRRMAAALSDRLADLPGGAPGRRRMWAVAALTAGVLVFAGALLWLILWPPGAPEDPGADGPAGGGSPAAAAERSEGGGGGAPGATSVGRGAESVLRQAEAALGAGEVEIALELLKVAEGMAPEDEGVAEQRRGLELRLADLEEERQREELEAGLRRARSAAEAGRWQQAREASLAVLALADEAGEAHPEAEAILARSDAAIVRESRQREEEARQPEAPAGAEEREAPLETAEPAPVAPVPEDGEAHLAVEFFTQVPEGVLTIYHGESQIVREPFRFYRRKLLRLEPVSGEIASSHTVPAGDSTLRVIVALPDQPPLTREIEASFPASATRTLRLRLEGRDELRAELE